MPLQGPRPPAGRDRRLHRLAGSSLVLSWEYGGCSVSTWRSSTMPCVLYGRTHLWVNDEKQVGAPSSTITDARLLLKSVFVYRHAETHFADDSDGASGAKIYIAGYSVDLAVYYAGQ